MHFKYYILKQFNLNLRFNDLKVHLIQIYDIFLSIYCRGLGRTVELCHRFAHTNTNTETILRGMTTENPTVEEAETQTYVRYVTGEAVRLILIWHICTLNKFRKLVTYPSCSLCK